MADLVSVNGVQRPDTGHEGTYIYVPIHVRHRAPLFTPLHLASLAAAAERIYALKINPDPKAIAETITALMHANRYPAGVSATAEVRIYDNGDTEVRCGEISLYDGYCFRSLRPSAVLSQWSVGDAAAHSSASRAAAAMARAAARTRNAHDALRITPDGCVDALGEWALFAVRGWDVILPPCEYDSAEARIVMTAIEAAGLGLHRETLRREDLRSYDELFCLDPLGVVSVAKCEGCNYMDIVARRIAKHLKGL